MAGTIDQLIVNGPYEEPQRHWRYDRESRTFNIFGIPFTFLPHDGGTDVVPPPPKWRIEAVPEKRHFEITWPNVVRVEPTWAPRLALDSARVPVLRLASRSSTCSTGSCASTGPTS